LKLQQRRQALQIRNRFLTQGRETAPADLTT
jgi:hypothetical protein